MASRIAYIDIARGLAIIFMVVGHTIGFGLGRDLIFAWHMPLFVVVSGMFVHEGTSVARTLSRNARKLLLPYAVVAFAVQAVASLAHTGAVDVGEVLAQAVLGLSFGTGIFAAVPSVGMVWFIPFLILTQLLFLGVLKLSAKVFPAGPAREALKAALTLVLTLAGIVLGVRETWLPWSADVACASVGFMYAGHELARLRIPERLFGAGDANGRSGEGGPGNAGNARAGLFSGRTLAVVAVLAVLFAVGVHLGTIELSVRHYPGGLACMATALAGCMLVFWLSSLLERFTGAVGQGLAWCGRNSLYLLMMHYIETAFIPYDALQLPMWQALAVRFAAIACLAAVFVAVRRAIRRSRTAK